jgi:hypothetical protein
MRCLLFLLALGAALAATCVANDLDKYAVWVTGDVINDKKDGLMFRADKPVQGNTTGNLVYLAVSEDLAKTFAPMCYRAAEKHMKLRLYGAFLPHSGPSDPKHPSVNFLIWKIHLPTDPEELSPDQKVIYGRDQEIPGYKIIPRKP